MVKVSRSIVPSFFTVGNMFCGFFSVVSALNNHFILAAWMIFAGAFLDAMDGKVARFTKSSSRFGVEYDSLADVITFGLAPSILVYIAFMQDMRLVGVLISFLPLLFGSIRLARFNSRLEGFDKEYFLGLPIPISALTLSSFVIFSEYVFGDLNKFPKILIVLIFLVSVLMVSTIRYETIPTLNFKGSTRDKLKVILMILAVILLIIFPQVVLFPFMILYILSGFITWILRVNLNTQDLKEDKIES
jgi:CDP-diacylglycerol--serine O-phosphatidyltransferase